jgi:biopolymer transport protein TolR
MPKVQLAGDNSAQRPGRRPRVATTLAEINVVPLVDVMLVLLVIFMVTAPMIQRGLDLNLPVSRRAAPITGERIFVSIPLTFRQTGLVMLNMEPVRLEVLQERIRQKIEGVSDKQVFLRGDAGVDYQALMDVIDKLKDAGVEKVGLVGKQPGER